MTFAEVVQHAATNKDLLREYDRLSGTNLALRGTPLDIQIDLATGRIEAEIPAFVEFLYEAIWLPLLAQEGGQGGI
jgi:hypothetical protein